MKESKISVRNQALATAARAPQWELSPTKSKELGSSSLFGRWNEGEGRVRQERRKSQ